jgi:hypothetical protein
MADDIGEKALTVVNEARGIVINTNEDLERAIALWEALDTAKKTLAKRYNGLIAKAYDLWKFNLAEKAQYYVPVTEVAAIVKLRIAEYKRLKEEERKVEESRLYTEAVKQTEEMRLRQAEENPDQAEEILAEPILVAPVIIPKDIPTGGPVSREIWDCEVVDFPALIKAVAEGSVDELALEPNTKFLKQQATSFKSKLSIAGCKPVSRLV